MMKRFILLLAALCVAYVPASYAATVKVKGLVTKTTVADAERWGGCMAQLDQKLADAGLNCPGKWVTFSCSGVYTEKDVAYRMFDQAQMALALGRKVEVYVDDTKKHNDYCYANQIRISK
jgi:hypothetical protein